MKIHQQSQQKPDKGGPVAATGEPAPLSKTLSAKLEPGAPALSRKDYRAQLRMLQIELVKLQRHVIRSGDKILVLFEGRDAAGKDGTIKRIVKYLSPRETRVVALGKPSDRDSHGWYFQRYVAQLPVAEELVFFNRSWYNRAGVEHVMGFCTRNEYEAFMHTVPRFEEMLVHSGFTLLKCFYDCVRQRTEPRTACAYAQAAPGADPRRAGVLPQARRLSCNSIFLKDSP